MRAVVKSRILVHDHRLYAGGAVREEAKFVATEHDENLRQSVLLPPSTTYTTYTSSSSSLERAKTSCCKSSSTIVRCLRG